MKIKIIILCFLYLIADRAFCDLTDDIEFDDMFFKEIKTVKKNKPTASKPPSLKKDLKKQMNRAKKSRSNKKSDCKIYFKGDQFRGSRESSLIELKGNVIVTRCGLEVKSDQARIYLLGESKEVKSIEALGNVRLKNYDQNTNENVSASGNELVYNRDKNLISLIGTKVSKAILKKGKDRFYGPTIKYDIDSGWIKAKKVEGVVHGGSL